MNLKLERAIRIAELAREKGQLTIKEAAWVGAAWVSFAAEAVVQLADPTEQVDKIALANILETSWERTRVIIDDVPKTWFVQFTWSTARSMIPSMIPAIVEYLANELDKGEIYE